MGRETERTRGSGHARLIARISGWRRGIAIGAGVVLAAGLAAGVAQFAGAAPQPTVSEVQAKINSLQAQLDKDTQQYDGIVTQVNAARGRLSQVNSEVATDNSRYQQARKRVVQIAAAGYMDSGQTSLAGLLTTSNPGVVLSEASILTELTGPAR
jgi:peptidoglycan DL-endopeptidase CwlO